MRFPVLFRLFFFLVLLIIGCRDPLTPNVDRNEPPETWITAAPQDTITIRNPDPIATPIGTIGVRFHLYWAGADRDGSIAGFYYAVVETLPLPAPGQTRVPPLPGPKARDYKFTTATDSTFIFRVSELIPDRQHAFYIFAVDDKGKADPTPARVIFNAYDRFPPLPVFEYSRADGFFYHWDRKARRVVVTPVTHFINDSLSNENQSSPPTDTVASNARLEFRWHGEPTIAGTYITGYRYKLDESFFQAVDSSVHCVKYNYRSDPGAGNCSNLGAAVVNAGSKVFTLRVVDQAEGTRVETAPTTRRFQMNFDPDTWFSGPDTTLYPHPPGNPFERSIEVPRWSTPPPFPGGILNCDSINLLPAERPQRRTFYEIYRNKLYARSENDTVHMNSWVIVHSGGSDPDSPYQVVMGPNDPTLADTVDCSGLPALVVRRTGPNGSPIGFRQQYVNFLSPTGPVSAASQSSLYPNFDVGSVFHAPVIGGYQAMRQAGKVYAVTRATDSEGGRDQRLRTPTQVRTLADKVDRGQGTKAEIALRSRILTFYVDKAPRLLTHLPEFVPDPNQVFPTRQISLNLLADDEDPLDPGNQPPSAGGPSTTKVLRWSVTIRGRDAGGRVVDYLATPQPVFNPQISLELPSEIVSTSDTVKVELCDCAACDSPGTGRCVTYDIPITVPPPTPGLESRNAPAGLIRPGTPLSGRRRAP